MATFGEVRAIYEAVLHRVEVAMRMYQTSTLECSKARTTLLEAEADLEVAEMNLRQAERQYCSNCVLRASSLVHSHI